MKRMKTKCREMKTKEDHIWGHSNNGCALTNYFLLSSLMHAHNFLPSRSKLKTYSTERNTKQDFEVIGTKVMFVKTNVFFEYNYYYYWVQYYSHEMSALNFLQVKLSSSFILTWAVESVTDSCFFCWTKTWTVLPTIQGFRIVALSCPELLTTSTCSTAFLEWTPVTIASINWKNNEYDEQCYGFWNIRAYVQFSDYNWLLGCTTLVSGEGKSPQWPWKICSLIRHFSALDCRWA